MKEIPFRYSPLDLGRTFLSLLCTILKLSQLVANRKIWYPAGRSNCQNAYCATDPRTSHGKEFLEHAFTALSFKKTSHVSISRSCISSNFFGTCFLSNEKSTISGSGERSTVMSLRRKRPTYTWHGMVAAWHRKDHLIFGGHI